MSVKERIVAGALTALFILVLVGAHVALVVMGKAPVDSLLGVLSSLVIAAVGLVNVFAGHASASAAAAQAASQGRDGEVFADVRLPDAPGQVRTLEPVASINPVPQPQPRTVS